MTPSVGPEADRELTDSALYYAREANAELGLAFIATFERALDLLCSNPQLGAPWRNERRRFPLARFPYSIIYYIKLNRVGPPQHIDPLTQERSERANLRPSGFFSIVRRTI